MKTTLKGYSAGPMAIFLTAVSLFAPLSVYAQQSSADEPLDLSVSADWREDSGSDYSAFRANDPHFWNWLKAATQGNALFEPQGVVTADPHVMNIADIRMADGSVEFGLVDVDDGGLASLLGDYLRLYTGNRISPYKVTGRDLFAAYTRGLQGQQDAAPAYWQTIQNTPAANYESAQQVYLQGLLKPDGKSFRKSSDILPLESAPASVQKVYQEAQAAILAQMQGYTILASGFKMKTGGGSQDLPRFEFSIQKPGESLQHIWEFKLESAPAVSLYLANQPQDPDARLKLLSDVYRPFTDIRGPYKMFQAGSYVFLVREKLYSYVHFSQEKDESNEAVQAGQAMSLYIANKMGLWQAQQGEGAELRQRLLNDSDAAFQQLKDLSGTYADLIKIEQKAHKK